MKQAVNFIVICLLALAVLVGAIAYIADKTEKKVISPEQNRELWIIDSVNHVRDKDIVKVNNAKIDSLQQQLATTREGRIAAEQKAKQYRQQADSARAQLQRERTLANCEKLVSRQDKQIAAMQEDIDSLDKEAQTYSEMLHLSKTNIDTLFVDNARLENAIMRANITISGLKDQAVIQEKKHRKALFWYKTVAVAEGLSLLFILFK